MRRPPKWALAWVLRQPGMVAIPKAGARVEATSGEKIGPPWTLRLAPQDDLAELDEAFSPTGRAKNPRSR